MSVTTTLATWQKPKGGGPPFVVGAAYNGVSVDPALPNGIVLGNNVGSVLARLLTTREIPNIGNTLSTIFYTNGNIRMGAPGSADQTQRLQVIGNFRLDTFIQEVSGNDNFFINVAGKPPGILAAAAGNYGIGADTLKALTNGTRNIALGRNILPVNTTGAGNVGIGNDAMTRLVSGSGNIAIGESTLDAATTAVDNIQIGRTAANSGITTGVQNTIVGVLGNLSGNLKTAQRNILIGYSIDSPGDNTGFSSIGNVWFYTGSTGINTTITPAAKAGVFVAAPAARLHVSEDPTVPITTLMLDNPTVDNVQTLNAQAKAAAGAFDGFKIWANNLTTFAQMGFAGLQTFGATIINTSSGASGNLQVTGVNRLTYDANGISTEDPNTGIGVWRLGKVKAAAVALSATSYVEVKIDGAVVKLAIVT